MSAQAIFLKDDPLRASTLNYDLAAAYEATGEPEAALLKLDQFLQSQPPGTEPYEFRARLLKQLGLEQNMLEWLRQAAERDNHNLALKTILARQYTKEGHPADAERVYLQIIAEAPSPEAYRDLFKLYLVQKRMKEALKRVNDAAAHDLSGANGPGAATQAAAMFTVFRADRQLAQGIIAAARAQFRQHGKLAPDTRRFLALLADGWRQFDAAEEFYRDYLAHGADPQIEPLVYARLLEVLWMEDKREAIVEVCRAGLTKAQVTNRALFHRHLARALLLSGRTEEALAEADQVVQLANDQNRVQSRLFRAQLLSTAGESKRAEEECLSLLKEAQRPGDVRDVRQTLSAVYSNAGKNTKAEEQLALILEADPNDPTANNDLGYLMADEGKELNRAEELIRRAIQLDREQKQPAARGEQDDDTPNAAYIDSLGWVLFRAADCPRLAESWRRPCRFPTASRTRLSGTTWETYTWVWESRPRLKKLGRKRSHSLRPRNDEPWAPNTRRSRRSWGRPNQAPVCENCPRSRFGLV